MRLPSCSKHRRIIDYADRNGLPDWRDCDHRRSPPQDVTVVSSTTIQLKSPLKAATCGKVPIVVTNPDGKTVTRSDLVTLLTSALQYSIPSTITMGTYPASGSGR